MASSADPDGGAVPEAGADPYVAELKIANYLAMAGEIDAAIEHFRSAVALNPNNSFAHDDLVYLLHFHPGYDDQEIFSELEIWERQHARPLARSIAPHQNNRDPNRRLKIGYVSPEFCRQAESFFVVPLLESHDHQNFEIHCYASVAKPDDRTEQIRKCADVWHDVLELNDAELAERIRADQIDILIDLTMHMRLSRLLTFARKPAPVQVTWLAYPGGTGLRTMDYRLTDRYFDPPGEVGWYTEEACRLPDCWICFEPFSQAALASPRTNGPICLGSLNHPRKLNDSILRLWAQAMRRVDDSRIILHVIEEEHRQRAAKIFESEGIAADRIEFLGLQPRWQYLRTYDRIDIALDTLPYNGITTTCDSLWMGTPVVSLTGQTAAGRAGLGILSTVGLGDLVAHSPDQFIEIVSQLAQDRARLIEFRKNLRRQTESSPLMDGKRFARNVETAYRWMWQQWCGKPDLNSFEAMPETVLESYRASRWLEAENAGREILARQPDHPEVLNMLGLIAAQTGRLPMAVEMLSHAVAQDSGNAVYRRNLGVVLLHSGRMNEAIAACRKAISLDPADAEAYDNLGICLRMRKDAQGAIRAFRRAVELNPDFARAKKNLREMEEAMAKARQG